MAGPIDWRGYSDDVVSPYAGAGTGTGAALLLAGTAAAVLAGALAARAAPRAAFATAEHAGIYAGVLGSFLALLAFRRCVCVPMWEAVWSGAPRAAQPVEWDGYSDDTASPFGAGGPAFLLLFTSAAVTLVGACAGATLAARLAAALSSALARAEGTDSSQWSTALQLTITYAVAVHWFQDAVPGVWGDLLEHDYRIAGGSFLRDAGLRPAAAPVEADGRRASVLMIAGFHTALAFVGFAAGNTLKPLGGLARRVPLGALLLGAWAAACYAWARLCVVDSGAGVRRIAVLFGWPVDADPTGHHFAAVAAASTAVWLAVPMALAALGRDGAGPAPRVVVSYCLRMLCFYAGALAFFRHLCAPVWDSLARHNVLMPAGGAPLADVRGAFAELAAGTHTLSVVLGCASCSAATRVLPALRARRATVLAGLTGTFAASMVGWVRYAFAARVGHVTGHVAGFVGPAAVDAAAAAAWSPLHSLVLGNYCLWFAAGVIFEQTWPGAASRPQSEKARRDEAVVLQDTFSLPLFLSAAAVLATPADWLSTVVASIVVACLLRPNPSQLGGVRVPRTPADAYLRREAEWGSATADCPATGDQYLVIGAGGFVGMRMVKRLLERGERRVRCFDISPVNPFDGDDRVEYVRGNVCKLDDLARAMEGVDTVFSVFAIIKFFERLPHQAALSYDINVRGTGNVIAACRGAGVPRLVQTSTSNVMATPCLATHGMTEESRYVARHAEPERGQELPSHNHYSWTKALAEQAVRAASGGALRTVSVRPCSGVYGFKDRQSTELMRGRFPLRGVQPAAKIDWVYVDNVVLGHLKAEARLREGVPGVAGEAFNIGNDDPVTYEDVISAMQHYSGWRVTWRVPLPAAMLNGLGHAVEFVQWVTQGRADRAIARMGLEMVTPACFETSGMNFLVSSEKARRVLNYRPLWSFDEGIQQTLAFWREHDGGR